MSDPQPITCDNCGGTDLEDGDDGYYYCQLCGSRIDGIMVTAVDDEEFMPGGIYYRSQRRSLRPPSQSQLLFAQQLKRKSTPSQNPNDDNTAANFDWMGPTEPADFGSGGLSRAEIKPDDYCKFLRWRYVNGLQIMIQLQCEALVEQFHIHPLICGFASTIWLRFVHSTRVFHPDWCYQTVVDSETRDRGDKKPYEGEKRYDGDPRNIYNERMVFVWCKSLKESIPLSSSLAITYLACHLAREPVLPTDTLRWSVEGKLPYFAAFVDIESRLRKLDKFALSARMPDGSVKEFKISMADPPRVLCPLSSSYMFRPSVEVFPQKLESMAASIAEKLGLSLPPVNFYGIACRYLKQLSLPVEKFISYAVRLFEWSTPPELWLSASDLRLPTRVCVMSIIIVTMRILYNINGFGKWEMSLSGPNGSSSVNDQEASSDPPMCDLDMEDNAEDGCASVDWHGDNETSSSSSVHKFESETAELLSNLAKKYDELRDNKYDFSKDLPTYLQYCRDVIFAGKCDDRVEEKLIDRLWDFYVKNQQEVECSLKDKAPEPNQTPVSTTQIETSIAKLKDLATSQLKIDMEENQFYYIPPRTKVKGNDYLHYTRKKEDGSFSYVAHADYYILLRACAKVAQVDARVMHTGVLGLERRLAWIEKRIDQCLQQVCSNTSIKSRSDLSQQPVPMEDSNQGVS